jgi:hypothetical protein
VRRRGLRARPPRTRNSRISPFSNPRFDSCVQPGSIDQSHLDPRALCRGAVNPRGDGDGRPDPFVYEPTSESPFPKASRRSTTRGGPRSVLAGTNTMLNPRELLAKERGGNARR